MWLMAEKKLLACFNLPLIDQCVEAPPNTWKKERSEVTCLLEQRMLFEAIQKMNI
jgi:hypothetical protein